jgi:hypothetical protein
MESGGSELPPPGWYPDPNDPSSRRYWDGSRWTDNRVPAATAAHPATVTPARPTNGKAIAALVLGITWICGIGSILALVFGNQAKNEIDASGGLEQGRGMATAGIVLGWVGIGFVLLYLVLYAFFGASLLLIGGSAD